MLTSLDQIANQNHLQLLKAMIPYLMPQKQKLFSVFAKFLELQNILSFYNRGEHCIRACDASSEPPGILAILNDIRNYCDEPEQEAIDQCICALSMMELYSSVLQEDPAAQFSESMEE